MTEFVVDFADVLKVGERRLTPDLFCTTMALVNGPNNTPEDYSGQWNALVEACAEFCREYMEFGSNPAFDWVWDLVNDTESFKWHPEPPEQPRCHCCGHELWTT